MNLKFSARQSAGLFVDLTCWTTDDFVLAQSISAALRTSRYLLCSRFRGIVPVLSTWSVGTEQSEQSGRLAAAALPAGSRCDNAQMIDLTKSSSFIASEAAMTSDSSADKVTRSDLQDVKQTGDPPTKTTELENDFRSKQLTNDESLYTFKLT